MSETFPTPFGRYNLVERLGTGGMAEVFLAEIEGPAAFTKRVVIKRLLPELTSEPEIVARFLEEARLSALLAHPNLVQVFELGDVNGDYYIAMEHISGADLRKLERILWAAEVELPIGIAAMVCAGVCRGLDHAHGVVADGVPLCVVHRDVSPSNVLLSFEGGVKLIDFGVARAHARARLTKQGTTIMGKLVYASPEQVLGLSVTARSDIFSVGCMLYEALTGIRPFERDTEPATLHAITRESVEPPSLRRPSIPAALDEIVMRALARKPTDRFATASVMARALESFVAERGQHIGTQQLASFVKAAVDEQDALSVTRVGESIVGILRTISPDVSLPMPSGRSESLAPGPDDAGAWKTPAERPLFGGVDNPMDTMFGTGADEDEPSSLPPHDTLPGADGPGPGTIPGELVAVPTVVEAVPRAIGSARHGSLGGHTPATVRGPGPPAPRPVGHALDGAEGFVTALDSAPNLPSSPAAASPARVTTPSLVGVAGHLLPLAGPDRPQRDGSRSNGSIVPLPAAAAGETPAIVSAAHAPVLGVRPAELTGIDDRVLSTDELKGALRPLPTRYIVGAIGAGALAAFLVILLWPRDAPQEQSTMRSGSPALQGPSEPPAPADLEAASTDAARRQATSEAPAPPPPAERSAGARRRMGRLRLASWPSGYVEVDGVRIAESTPVRDFLISPGVHRVRVVNERLGRSATFGLRVLPGRVVARSIRLRRNPALIKARPR